LLGIDDATEHYQEGGIKDADYHYSVLKEPIEDIGATKKKYSKYNVYSAV
jgi:hypothetical protein